ncbi:Molybdenum cofactor biosynthesis protein 1 [Thelohanellus kitauei]|uniref:Molybdenum cofactor biosynthesis protein 1 n=1 Tax=Thelohanellus kitauei TaxID=669202 RepID=A0A0C2JTF8_THEKT|nr:Molybdenum cofactor biosynthesis protein 1 [Thelohanellus kitauei]
MPFKGNHWDSSEFVSKKEMLQQLSQKYTILPTETPPNSTATVWDKYGTRFGIVSSMSDDFCSSCNRIRVGPTGKVQMCLFSDQTISLKKMVHDDLTDTEMFELVQNELLKKKFKHNGIL